MFKKVANKTFIITLLLAFCLHITLPLFASYAAAPSKENLLTVNGKVLLCLPGGLEWVDVDKLNDEPQHPKQSQYACAACYLQGHNADDDALLPAGNAALLAPKDALYSALHYYQNLNAYHGLILSSRTRAPPPHSFC